MPIYKYRCEECKEEFEELVPFSLSNDVECPNCGSRKTEKKVTTFATMGGSTASRPAGSCGSARGGFS